MSLRNYFDLTVPAPKRLAAMRAAFAAHATKYPLCPTHAKPASWRDMRGTTFAGVADYRCELSQGKNGPAPVWYAHTGEQFRGERFADEVDGGPGHKGWFTNSDSGDYVNTARGIVARLPHGRFIAGYALSDSGERVYFPDVHDDERDAAQMADEHARIVAESEAEYGARDAEFGRLCGRKADLQKRLRELAAIKKGNADTFTEINGAGELDDIQAELVELADTMARDFSDFEA